jgi:hypothetical protein
MLDKQDYMHARARTQLCSIYCCSMAAMIRERALMLRYMSVLLFLYYSYQKDERANSGNLLKK